MYHAPITDIMFTLISLSGLDMDRSDLNEDTLEAILSEAGRMSEEVLAPLNKVGDQAGQLKLDDGNVITAKGFSEAYTLWREAGWNGLSSAEAYGGQALPVALNMACAEMWNAANLAFALCPLLTAGAIEALSAHGSDALKATYLEKLISGEWSGTMNLTEPQAGSDLSALRTRAEPSQDDTYRLFGQKIYITYGEHDMAENICHLVLARLPDAPSGVKGISLFLVPKILPDGRRNDLVCSGLEHKLGIHASPTCTMIFGEEEGAIGWLIGEEHHGLSCMFTMMNSARLAVGVQGVGIGERAYQKALHFANERRQGSSSRYGGEGMAPIIYHPDIAHMLMTMRTHVQAARALCYSCAHAIDMAKGDTDIAVWQARADLLTPLAKSYATDMAVEVASLGIQVHGGMGYIEETGAAQYLRDARILPIYEGTNGVQALDLIGRKLMRDKGAAALALIHEMIAFSADERTLLQALNDLEETTQFMLSSSEDQRLASATAYQRLFALCAGAAFHVKGAAINNDRQVDARFYIDIILPQSISLKSQILNGSNSVIGAIDTLAQS